MTNVHPAANGEPVLFTDEERDATERHLKMCMSIMNRDKPSKDGAWAVTDRFKNSLVAQGLWFYADQLVNAAMVNPALEGYNISDTKVAELLRSAMIARIKAVKIFPLPIGVYHVAVLAAALEERDAARILSGFVEEQSKYVPDDLEARFIKNMGWDISAAVCDARKRLGLD